jgi:hypothetical protein
MALACPGIVFLALVWILTPLIALPLAWVRWHRGTRTQPGSRSRDEIIFKGLISVDDRVRCSCLPDDRQKREPQSLGGGNGIKSYRSVLAVRSSGCSVLDLRGLVRRRSRARLPFSERLHDGNLLVLRLPLDLQTSLAVLTLARAEVVIVPFGYIAVDLSSKFVRLVPITAAKAALLGRWSPEGFTAVGTRGMPGRGVAQHATLG